MSEGQWDNQWVIRCKVKGSRGKSEVHIIKADDALEAWTEAVEHGYDVTSISLDTAEGRGMMYVSRRKPVRFMRDLIYKELSVEERSREETSGFRKPVPLPVEVYLANRDARIALVRASALDDAHKGILHRLLLGESITMKRGASIRYDAFARHFHFHVSITPMGDHDHCRGAEVGAPLPTQGELFPPAVDVADIDAKLSGSTLPENVCSDCGTQHGEGACQIANEPSHEPPTAPATLEGSTSATISDSATSDPQPR